MSTKFRYVLALAFACTLGSAVSADNSSPTMAIEMSILDTDNPSDSSSSTVSRVVPEPATLGLALMGGLFGTAVFLRRRWG